MSCHSSLFLFIIIVCVRPASAPTNGTTRTRAWTSLRFWRTSSPCWTRCGSPSARLCSKVQISRRSKCTYAKKRNTHSKLINIFIWMVEDTWKSNSMISHPSDRTSVTIDSWRANWLCVDFFLFRNEFWSMLWINIGFYCWLLDLYWCRIHKSDNLEKSFLNNHLLHEILFAHNVVLSRKFHNFNNY